MNILFVTVQTLEDPNERWIYPDLLRYFRDMGHNVYVVTPRERRCQLDTTYEMLNQINFLKVRTGNQQKVNFIEKGISTLLLPYQYLSAIKNYFSNISFDLILYTTPPITYIEVIRYLKRKDNPITYLLLKDIFPQNAIDIHVLPKSGFIHRYFKKIEQKLYDVSDYIGTMSLRNSQYIIEKNSLNPAKVEVCPNTITPRYFEFTQSDKENIRKKYNIPIDKTVFIYGGNLGRPQGIDFIIECIELNERNDQSFFIIVGSGTEYSKLFTYLQENSIENTILIDHLPKDEYDLLVNSSDVGLIFLDYRFTIPNFPSRILSYMEASIPVIAATDPNTDIGDVIEAGNFGRKLLSNNSLKFNQVINDFATRDDLIELGLNGKDYLEKHYRTEVAYNIIMDHFG